MKNLLLIVFLKFMLSSFLLFSQTGPGFYGFQTHFGQFYRADMDSANMEAMLDLVQAAGFKMIRDECYWSEVEKVRGIFNFPEPIDNYIRAAKRRGIDVLLILNYNNPLYAPHAGSAVTTDSNRMAFARYCQEVVKRYSPLGITYYEIWNEPNIPIFWDPTPNATDYVRLLQTAYPAIKFIDSTATVIGCATSPAEGNPPPFIDWLTFIRRAFQQGGGDYMDAVSFHSYHVDQRPEANFFTDFQKLQNIVGTEKSLWLTEIGYPTNTGWPIISLEQQANYTSRLFLLGKGVEQLQLISYYDLKNDGEQANNPEHNFGVLFFNLQPKPLYHALKTFATLIVNKAMVKKTTVGDVYILEFGERHEWVTAIWKSSGQASHQIKIRSPFCRLITRDGNVQNDFVTADSTVIVTAEESPCYLCGLQSAPMLTTLDLQPNRVILYPQQSFEMRASGKDTAGVYVQIQLSALHWQYSGKGGKIDSLGKFQALDVGEGLIVGSYQSLCDTIFLQIVSPGTHIIDEFNSVDQWQLSTLNLDSLTTTISISDSIFSSENSSARLDYQFTYQTSIPKNQYQVLLETELLLPGKPDSLLIDFYGNGQPQHLSFQFRDAFGGQFIRLLSMPLDWNQQWRSAKIPLKNLPAGIDYPLSLNLITIYIGQDNPQNNDTYQGTIYLDKLRTKSNLSTQIAKDETEKSLLFYLYQNYPNPFNYTTTIRYRLSIPRWITLTLFNLEGQQVTKLVNQHQEAGEYQIRFNAEGLASGIYFYRLDIDKFQEIRKMLILR